LLPGLFSTKPLGLDTLNVSIPIGPKEMYNIKKFPLLSGRLVIRIPVLHIKLSILYPIAMCHIRSPMLGLALI
jgi:hypothetical protein